MKSALRIIIFVLVMGTVSGGMLIGFNGFTAPRIAKNEELKLKSTVLEALEIPYEKSNALELFGQQVEVLEKGNNKFYKGKDGTIAFEFKGPGLWGTMYGIVSINADLKTIRIIKILHQEETPGLGSRVAEKEYLSQFKHKEFIPKIIFMPQGKSRAKNEVDAITGATGTSKAFEKLLNDTIEKNIRMLKG